MRKPDDLTSPEHLDPSIGRIEAEIARPPQLLFVVPPPILSNMCVADAPPTSSLSVEG
jgi:hypothetical protein